MNTISQRKECELEALEPRLLLSADGLLPVLAAGVIVDAEAEDDVFETEEQGVVVAYSIEAEAGENGGSDDSDDSIFDVSGQVMEESVAPAEGEESALADVAIVTVAVANSIAGTSDPSTATSTFDSSGQTSQQLVDTLNAANGPPAQGVDQTVVSSVSSPETSGESGSLQSQALSVSGGGDVENLPPPMLADEDFTDEAPGGLADGIDLLGDRVDIFLNSDDLLGDRIPMILMAGKDGDGNPVYEAPTLLDMLSVPVDANQDGGVNILGFPFTADDNDELVLQDLDNAGNGDGVVDPGEFLQGWFFGPIADFLNSLDSSDSTGDLVDFLDEFEIFGGLPRHLDLLDGYYDVDFDIINVSDTTETPDAEYTFTVGFLITITQMMPIDLGLQADALKLFYFTGDVDNPGQPKVEVTSTLTWTFEFGIFTGGQSVVDANDFFIRRADPIEASVVSTNNADLNFHMNIGFLGADVENGTLNLDAEVLTLLLDPDTPAVLGFSEAQRGEEETSGVVTADDALDIPEDHSAGFFLRIGNLGIATPVTVVDSSPGVVDTEAQVILDVEAALVAANLDDLVSVSVVGGHVQFALVATSDNPLGFGNEALSLAGSLLGTPAGDGPNDWEYTTDQTFLVSVDGALPKLVTVHFPDPAKEDIGFDYDQSAELLDVILAPSAPSLFDITGNANITVTATLFDGSQYSASIVLTATDTDGLVDVAGLAGAIDDKFMGTDTYVYVLVSSSGGKVRFSAFDPDVSAIRVQASGTATTEIGLAADASVTSQVVADGTPVSDGVLSGTATMDITVTTVGVGMATTRVTISPDGTNASPSDLAADIDAALATAGLAIDAIYSGGKIVLVAQNIDVANIVVGVGNQDLDDFIADINAALVDAGLSGVVSASDGGGGQVLLSTASGSIEISHTLTFDAGVTFFELFWTPTEDLFGASEGGDSKVEVKLPVQVLPGLYDDVNDVADWDPANVAIVGNFDPFNAPGTAEYDESAKRFELLFTYDPAPTVPEQDTPVPAVPSIASLSNEIRLVNFGELLNFTIVSSESVIGLIAALGTALQQLALTPQFKGFEIPFADATLSDLLNFADDDKAVFSGLIDILIFDTKGDGIDGDNGDANGLFKKISVDGTTLLVPTFSTAQTLASRLGVLLAVPVTGDGGINATYNTSTNELTYDVDLAASDRTAPPGTVSFEHDVALDPFSKLGIDTSVPATDTSVELGGRTGLGMTFGVDLSPPGFVIFPTTPLSQLNGFEGIDISAVRGLTGETGVRSIYGITQDSKFKISVDGGDAYEVTVTAASTANNLTRWDLVTDYQDAIDAALLGTPGEGKINVGLDLATGTRFGMEHVDRPGHHFQIYVGAGDPLVTEIGFPNKISSGVPQEYEIFIAPKPAPLLVGRLSGFSDATFEIDFLTDRDGNAVVAAPIPVAISVASTAGNRSPADLVADVNNALVLALAGTGFEGMVKASFDNSLVSGTRLVLVAGDNNQFTNDTLIEFTVQATNAKAHDELGLPNAATPANQYDFVIFDHAGVAHPIILDPTGLDRTDLSYDPLDGLPNDPNVDDLLNVINAWFPGMDPLVEASFNGLHTGLRLRTNGAGAEQFRVETINDSGALVGIGLFLTGDDALPDTFGDGDPDLIEGGGIGLTHLDERFFVRDAQLRIDGLYVKTPDVGVPGQGLYGIVGVDVDVTGSYLGNVTADLTDPINSKSWMNQITLTELLDVTGTLADPVVNNRVFLNYDNAFAGFVIGKVVYADLSYANSAIVVDIINVSGDTGTLVLSNVKGTFANDVWLVQPAGGVADVNGTTSTAGSFGSFELDVKVQPGFDDLGFDSDFNALDGATYNIPFYLTGFGEPFTPTDPTTSALNLALLGDLQPLDKLSYNHIASMLEGLLTVLEDVDANFVELNLSLPAINRSVGQLLHMVQNFSMGVDNADAVLDAANFAIGPDGLGLPALRLQDLPRALRGAFGLPVGVDPDGVDTVNWVKLDYDTGADEMLVMFNLHQEISTKLGLDIETGGGSPNLTSAGVLEVTGMLDILLNLAIDLGTPDDIYLLDSSSISGSLHVQGEGAEYANGEAGLGLVFRSAIGPLAVFIQDGDALIDFKFSLPGLDFGGGSRKLLADVVYDDWKAPVIDSDTIEIVLPMFYGGEGPANFIGEYSAMGTVGAVTIMQPDFSDIVDDITNEVVVYDPFENILLAIDALNIYLESLSDQLSGDVLGIKLPFIGDQMADVLFIEDFRSVLVRTLKNGIENTINPDPDTRITQLLTGLFGPAGALNGYLLAAVVNTKNLAGAADTRFRQWNFTIGHTDVVTIDDFVIGAGNLGFDLKVPVTVTFEWSIEIGFGVNFGDGAYIDVSGGNEINLNLTIELPSDMDTTSYKGELGFLRLNVKDPGTDSGAKVLFDVDVQDGSGFDGKLGFAELGSLLPVATVEGQHLGGSSKSATLEFETDFLAAPGLPKLTADFVFDWLLPPSTSVDSLDGDAVVPGIELIELNNITEDPLSAVKQLLGPAFEKIAEIIQPFMPVIDLLTAPIPILSDLAGEPFTLLDLAGIFGDVDPRFIEAVADILDVIIQVNSLVNLDPLPLGSITLYDPNNSIFNFDPSDVSSHLGDINVVLEEPGKTPGLTHDKSAFDLVINSSDFLIAVRDQTLAEGLTMPILTDARQGIKLLLDQDATMVDYELPPLGVGFEYLQVFPVWGPLAVSIEISFSFTVDLHSVGFDTFGYRRYSDGGFRNPFLIFDGFYLNDDEPEGVDAPEIVFEFGLVGAAEINLGIARAGVGGGIDATIIFDWRDSIDDGHMHVSEIIGNIVAEGGNPLAMFDVSGALTFELFAFLEISVLGIDLDFPITPKTELFDFNPSFDRAPLLATKVGDTLYLNIGPNAQDRLNGDTSDGNETISLMYDSGDIKVWSDPLGVGSGKAQKFSGITHIVGLGGNGDDTITLDGFDGSGITGDFDGGVGDDRIEFINTSASNNVAGSRIVGGLGNDILSGGDANDTIIGGEGNDTIRGNGGFDILFGDQGRNANASSPKFISVRINESDGDDDIDGGKADDVVIGGGGSDVLRGGDGNDLIIGDGGRFEYTLTDGHINIAALRPAPYVPEPINGAPPSDPEKISDDIDAKLDFVLSKVRATELGLGGNDEIHGDDGDDLAFGGTGDDDIEGNDGDDFLVGGKGFDHIKGGMDDDTIFGGDQADTLYGNEGDDVMSGGSGNDFMHGNEDDDVMKGDTGADVMFGDAGDDQVFGQTEPDVLFGGIGNDLVVGGSSNDIMFGDDGIVAKLDTTDGHGVKVIGIGFGGMVNAGDFYFDSDVRTIDVIVTDVTANDGNDILSGDSGEDIMLGGGGNDLMGGDVDPRLASFPHPTELSDDVLIGDGGQITLDHRRFKKIETVIGTAVGAPFNDVIYGDNGNDYIFGGRDSDVLFGGHGKVVTDVNAQTLGVFRGSTDAGARDNDIIVGDNGEMFFADGTIPANYGRLELVRTTDVSDSTGGHEYAEGELGNDVIFGGVNGSVDVLHGNAGDDVILGDNGELDFALGADTDLDTLDLIRSYRDGLGGIDIVLGDADADVLIGGTAGDEMYGDDASASHGALDGEDIMLGDNGDIFLIDTVGRLKVKVATMTTGTAVDIIKTTDTSETTGGADTMSGNAKADIMLGGVNNGGTDTMYGDRAATNATTIADDGDDILLGDNGELDFTYLADTNRMTLDLIRSYQDSLGGHDVISGNKGLDVGIGGTGDDTIYGDDATASAGAADLADLLLGDNADIFLVAVNGATGADLKVVLDSAVYLIRTTDTGAMTTGGVDTISGNARGDIIAGGIFGDWLYGDRASPNATTSANDGNDIILGDNGAFEWLSTGRLGEITGIDIAANNADLWAKYGTNVADTNLGTLDLITTEQPTRGGRDRIWGDEGSDIIFGGTDLDVIYGDDGDGVAAVNGSLNRDVIFGDHGRLYPQFARFRTVNSTVLTPANFHARNFFAINVGNASGGEGDVMYGEEGADVMLGQQGDDRMWGGSGDDDMIGGHNVAGGYDELTAPAVVATLNPPMNDLIDGGTGDDAIAGDNAIIWRRSDDFSPRFRILTSGQIYTTGPDGVDTIVTNIDGIWHSDPQNVVGRDIQLLDHSDAVEANPLGRFGADVIAGGADRDVVFGQLGNDLIQGDGSISTVMGPAQYIVRTLTVTDTGVNPDTDAILYFNIPEAPTDGNDYIEGNGGSDLIYGGLGQDDILGGSSSLFGLDASNAVILGVTAQELRPDGSDIIYGGAGNPPRLVRNDFVGSTDTAIGTSETTGARATNDDPMIQLIDRHSRDSDYILGDNANIYRLVNSGSDTFLQFNYDQTGPFENRGSQRIIVRAMVMLDYTLGGADFTGGSYTNGAANLDNGAGDIIHGESGDDFIFGETGSDALYGDSDDDDIIGGYGNDWISGGTGQDGVIGDDGLIYTSRNSTLGEPLYGVAGLLANDPSTKYSNGNALDETISTPGAIQIAIINPTGALKKAADLVPFSYDHTWLGLDDEFPDNQDSSPFADDIIFGGLDSDWLHGGSGDDAILGGEALPSAYITVFTAGVPTGVLNLGYSAFFPPNPVNPGETAQLNALTAGDWLAFNPIDVDGQHQNNRFRAGEFFLYDEYDPRREIRLSTTGGLYKSASGVEGVDWFPFLLNFNGDEGVYRPAGNVPKATGQQTESYGVVRDDGKDAIFGDLGNDWLVGGTGRDNIYGGWGNDLLNADDVLSITDDSTKQNTVSDTHPTFEDRAYGGAGRDILIGNTGGDRLIDWVGEYNSYLVPYAPFGQASVSRTLQPFLPEFLYALSAGDGADFTRYADAVNGSPPTPSNNDPIPSRFGEPHGELGLVLQKDFAWQDQTGAPADPQAGNIPGGHRDVLRSASFNDGSSDGFFVDSGKWTVKGGAYTVEPLSKGGDALSVFYVDDFVPSYFEVLATLNPVKPTGGYKANAYIVFDYQSETDFKFAGIDVSTNKLVIGHRGESGWIVDTQASIQGSLKAGTNYNIFLSINGSAVTVIVDNKTSASFVFAPRIDAQGISHGIHDGMVGLGADNAKAMIDNMVVQRLAPEIKYTKLVDFSSGLGGLLATPLSGTWNLASGHYVGVTPAGGFALDLGTLFPAPASYIEFSSILATTGAGGLVFDAYGANAFKFATIDNVAGTVTLGHRTSKGWFTDAVYTNTSIKTSADQSLAITIKGTTVSVKWNNQLVISFVYNALVTDGATGLLSSSGTTSFNEVKFQTDDATLPQTAMSTSGTSSQAVVSVLPSGTTVVQPIEADSTLTIPATKPVTPVFGSLVNAMLDGSSRSSIGYTSDTESEMQSLLGTTGTPEQTQLTTVDASVSIPSAAKRVIGSATRAVALSADADGSESQMNTTSGSSTEADASTAADEPCCEDDGVGGTSVDHAASGTSDDTPVASDQVSNPHMPGDTKPKGPSSKDDSGASPAGEA